MDLKQLTKYFNGLDIKVKSTSLEIKLEAYFDQTYLLMPDENSETTIIWDFNTLKVRVQRHEVITYTELTYKKKVKTLKALIKAFSEGSELFWSTEEFKSFQERKDRLTPDRQDDEVVEGMETWINRYWISGTL